jgi:hypothetical protein
MLTQELASECTWARATPPIRMLMVLPMLTHTVTMILTIIRTPTVIRATDFMADTGAAIAVDTAIAADMAGIVVDTVDIAEATAEREAIVVEREATVAAHEALTAAERGVAAATAVADAGSPIR